MAHSLDYHRHGYCKKSVLRLVLAIVGVFLVGCIIGPPSYWRLKNSSSDDQAASCPSCVCQCSSDFALDLPLELFNSSSTDCGKDDPELNEEMEKSVVDLLGEELTLQKIVANETLERTKVSIMDAKRASSHYKAEAEKCNVGMETCETARERAQKELVEEQRLSAVWEERAREHGWKDDGRVYTY